MEKPDALFLLLILRNLKLNSYYLYCSYPSAVACHYFCYFKKIYAVKNCGYSGLMLPVRKDIGLAKRANEQTYDLTDLLLYSAVCGCGLDTVTIPDDVTIEEIEYIIRYGNFSTEVR